MKWFKHSVHARSEHGIEDILRCHGPAGIGIYWCLLEMLAKDTERFRLRIAGISAEADERFEQARTNEARQCPADHLYRIDLLARTLNTEPEKIAEVVSLGVSEGLFDRDLWLTYSILHSSSLCHQADEYTRRLRRSSQRTVPAAEPRDPSVETLHRTPESLPIDSGEPPIDSGEPPIDSGEPPIDEMREKKRKDKPKPHAGVSGASPSGALVEESTIDRDIDALQRRTRLLVADWNRRNRRDFELRLSRAQWRRLTGGDPLWRERVCYESMNLMHGGSTFEDVILRGLWLMLESSRSRPIGDQFAWLWSCIHGTDGSPPWVHRPTPAEESRPGSRRVPQAESEFRTIGELLARRTSSDGGSAR